MNARVQNAECFSDAALSSPVRSRRLVFVFMHVGGMH